MRHEFHFNIYFSVASFLKQLQRLVLINLLREYYETNTHLDSNPSSSSWADDISHLLSFSSSSSNNLPGTTFHDRFLTVDPTDRIQIKWAKISNFNDKQVEALKLELARRAQPLNKASTDIVGLRAENKEKLNWPAETPDALA